jgi:exodeoxyribonuclease VII large subunit
MTDNSIQRRIYSVSELTADIKSLLEENFPFIWISGEISNFRVPVSGHFYFTLKDENAQISAVMFRAQNRNLKFDPEDGISVTGLGRISVYEPRGSYQIILEYLEPAGVGAIQVAFEQLKARLAEEGLFDNKHKISLPFLPQKISIITSPTGAVIHDILKIINRRFPNLQVEIVPVKVQGDGAEEEITAAFDMLHTRRDADVIILARGGGSLEDLHAFNSEDVARAIFSSKIPVISAVGHETDFSIADFVADLRAPTPSAAAELAVPLKHDLKQKQKELTMMLTARFLRYIELLQTTVNGFAIRLVDPRKKIEDFRLRTDDLTSRLVRQIINKITQKRERLAWRIDNMQKNSPLIKAQYSNDKLEQMDYNLLNNIKIYIDKKHFLIRELTAKLHTLNPDAILDRGYSITRTIPDGMIVKDPKTVHMGQDLELTLAKGSLICGVKGK